jgi:broad specificity phosphatase PhoE
LTAIALFAASVVTANAITLTFIRHGESFGNTSCCIDTTIPGPDLTPNGVTQANTIAQTLYNEFLSTGPDHVPFDAIYASDMVRTQQTAAPFSDLMSALSTGTDYSTKVLTGLHEIQAGIYEGQSQESGIGRILYALTALSWVLGLRFVPMLGSADYNGNEFEARVNSAITTIEGSGAQFPAIFSHGLTIMTWVLMNVKNPDVLLMFQHPLGNTATVTVTGNSTDGWTLENWDGIAVAADPGLLTNLFVDTRDLIVAPQTALYDVRQALQTRDLKTIVSAISTGVVDVLKATAHYPIAVTGHIVEAIVTAVKNVIDRILPAKATPFSASAATVLAATTAGSPTADTATPATDNTKSGATSASADTTTQAAPDRPVTRLRTRATQVAEKSIAAADATAPQRTLAGKDNRRGAKASADPSGLSDASTASDATTKKAPRAITGLSIGDSSKTRHGQPSAAGSSTGGTQHKNAA